MTSRATSFSAVYNRLNAAQKAAVDAVYGPVLVIAGPGTGKTQLLSARVANILQVTDALAHNILCLTFTENGARNMRERLGTFIGQAAYDVQIGTYHAFGSTIINRYPEYFTDLRLERPVDELGKRQILAEIIDSTDYRSPLKQVRHHLGDLVSTISEVKRGLLTADDLRALSKENIAVIRRTQHDIAAILEPYAKTLPRTLTVALPLFQNIAEALTGDTATYVHPTYTALNKLAADELERAMGTAELEGKTTPLTKWKNIWLVKDSENRYKLAGELESRRIAALADVLEHYQNRLAAEGLYDFDDMIVRAIDVLEHNDDLRFTLQEQYQFILLDEFQDTNAAQFKLVQLLTNNPVSEGKPNVLAVGDDDQAIYAFQGAQYSNMLDFYHEYTDVQVLSLEENYRSQAEILETAAQISGQIQARLVHQLDKIQKNIHAVSSGLPPVQLARRSYKSDVAERSATARQIADLLAAGVSPGRIAVLAPKHKYLEPLVAYLHDLDVPVRYEKREDILQTPIVRQLITMSKLVLALHASNHALADSLWPEVLSYDFWDFSTADIWNISWKANDGHTTWSELLLGDSEFRHAALLILTLAVKVETEPLEYMLDALIGNSNVETHDRSLPDVRSPLREYYFHSLGEQTMYETVTQLTVLRTKLREHQASEGGALTLADLIHFTQAYAQADQPMLNTSPYNQASDAVSLMTVYKAKGLEFDHVFLIACDDSVWGSKAAGIGNKLTLPANLAHIRHAGSSDDERLRLLYVALTRARYGLHLSSHHQTFSGRSTEPVKYFNEIIAADGTQRSIGILPEGYREVLESEAEEPDIETLRLNWRHRHTALPAPLTELLQGRLQKYRLSPTHLTHFLDLKYGGPESFLLGTILRFPSAPVVDASFGNAIHDALQWVQDSINMSGAVPPTAQVVKRAESYLMREPLTPEQLSIQIARAHSALESFLLAHGHEFVAGNVAEKSFRDEGVFSGDVHLGGKIDLLQIDTPTKQICVVDYKTGRLGSDPTKLRRNTLQLYCYKLLVEGSHSYSDYTVPEGKLVFVEPNDEGRSTEIRIVFTEKEMDHVKALLSAMWQSVMSLSLPDVSAYGDTIKDMRAFENALVGSAQ